MLFYRLEPMTSTSLMTNITKLQGSGYLDMMRYSYVGFFSTSVKLDSLCQIGYFVAYSQQKCKEKNGDKTIKQYRLVGRTSMVLAGSWNNFTENCT